MQLKGCILGEGYQKQGQDSRSGGSGPTRPAWPLHQKPGTSFRLSCGSPAHSTTAWVASWSMA